MTSLLKRVPLLNAALVLATLFAVGLHGVRVQYAGALWRDEASSIQTSMAPTWERFWDIWRFDSFPLTWVGVLRGWCEFPGGDTDMGLRWLGMLTGVAIVAALWLNARWMGHRFPVVALSLFALNPIVLIYGDSMRAYGFGVLLAVLLFGLLWRLGQHFSRGRFVAALVVALLTVHCLYNHAVTLFAMGIGVIMACGLRRAWREGVAVLVVGLIAAVSLVPLLPNIERVNEMWDITKSGFSAANFVHMIKLTVASQHPIALGAWCAVALLAAVVVVGNLKRKRPPDTLIVAAFTAVLLVGGTLAFLRHLGLPTQPWYYINLLAVLAICADMTLAPLLANPHGRRVAAVLVALVVVVSIPTTWRATTTRMTNIDVIAGSLNERSSPDDYIILNPYFLGVSFDRYYDGPAPWVTLPPLKDPSVHRYDELKLQMMQPDAMGPVLDKIRLTLNRGGRVWIVRQRPSWPADQPVWEVPPALRIPLSWDSGAYLKMWMSQVDVFLREQAATITRIDLPDLGAVIPYEETWIEVAQGIRSTTDAVTTAP